jgi:hypothetical protein
MPLQSNQGHSNRHIDPYPKLRDHRYPGRWREMAIVPPIGRKNEGGYSFRHIALQSESMSLEAWINELNIGLSTVTGIAAHTVFLE